MDPTNKHTEVVGARFLTIRKRICKCGKGKNQNKPVVCKIRVGYIIDFVFDSMPVCVYTYVDICPLVLSIERA